jgi:hypothetical protein
MSAPEKKKPGATLAGATGRKLTQAGYHTLHFLQAPLGLVFWLIEQRKGRLQNRMENERGAR